MSSQGHWSHGLGPAGFRIFRGALKCKIHYLPVSHLRKLLGLVLLTAFLIACESIECKLAKERETEAVLAKEKADMEFFPTALSRKIKTTVNKRLKALELKENKLPPLIPPYAGQEAYERKLLNASVNASYDEGLAKSLRIRVCKS